MSETLKCSGFTVRIMFLIFGHTHTLWVLLIKVGSYKLFLRFVLALGTCVLNFNGLFLRFDIKIVKDFTK